MRARWNAALAGAAAALVWSALPAGAQDDESQRIAERLRALREEADALAAQEKTVLGELRALEVERDLRVGERRAAEAELAAVTRDLENLGARIEGLDRQRAQQIPGLAARLRELYKLGAGGYARLLLSMEDPRQIGRASRAVAALARIDRERVRAHDSTLASLTAAREELEARRARAAALQAEARAAAMAATRAVAARAALITRLDARRDLNAQLVGELQLAQQKLNAAVEGLGASSPVAGVPIRGARGTLAWPVNGQVAAAFGRAAPNRPGRPATGIELAVPPGSPVRAIQGGTVVHSGPFTGYGLLVIVDHGDTAYSLYGYLASLAVRKGERLGAGTVVGESGTAPAGGPRTYFELRIDGRAVDPLQWLKSRP